MKLRDEDYKSFSDLCDSLGCNEGEITKKLNDAGFEYNESIKQFR